MSLEEAFIWLLDRPARDGAPGFCGISVGFSTGDLQPVLGLTLEQPLTALHTTEDTFALTAGLNSDATAQ